MPEQFIHFQLGDHGRMFAVQVFLRLVFFGTGGQDGDPVLDDSRKPPFDRVGLEIADKPVHAADGCFQVHGDVLFRFHTCRSSPLKNLRYLRP